MKDNPATTEAPAPPGFNDVGDEPNKFRLVTLTCQRARQLQNGARPRLEVENHKFLRVALLEVMAGVISWSVLDAVPPKPILPVEPSRPLPARRMV